MVFRSSLPAYILSRASMHRGQRKAFCGLVQRGERRITISSFLFFSFSSCPLGIQHKTKSIKGIRLGRKGARDTTWMVHGTWDTGWKSGDLGS
jgi:hypothetical protein